MANQKGWLVKIHLENFQAFDEIDLKPREKLNLIIGANGAGKSTFMCAIVLGLGGKPTIIGRSPNLSDYVKHGREKAIIELELFNPNGNNFIISRHITNKSHSEWFLQHKSVSFQRIETLMSELNIQINNLCQILPQDRVQDFAKMNPRELLDNTLKAVGDPSMYEWFQKLKNFRSSIANRELTLAEKLKLYETEMQRHKRMEADVKTYKEKQDVLNQIPLIELKLKWLQYEEKDRLKNVFERELEAAMSVYKARKSELQPFLKKEQEAEKSQMALHNKMKAQKNHQGSLNNAYKEAMSRHLSLIHKMSRINEELQLKLNAEAEKGKNIDKIEADIKLEEANLPKLDANGLTKEIREVDQEVESLQKKIRGFREVISGVNDKEMSINQAFRAVEHKMQQLNSVKERRLTLLSDFEDVRKAYNWLQNNRVSGEGQQRFHGNIYGPVFLEVNVVNPKNACFFEHIISWRDLVAFVCDDAGDVTRLLRVLRDQMGLKINVIHSEPPERPLSEMFRPPVPISQLKRLGFSSYLLDLIEGPPSILKYLCTANRLHLIPVGSRQVDDNLASVPKEISMFFSEGSFFQVSYSKFSKEKSMNTNPVRDKAKFLGFSVNRELLQNLNIELERKKRELEAVQRELAEAKEGQSRLEIEVNTLRNKKRELASALERLKTLQVRLRLKREELAGLRADLSDPASLRASAQQQTQECIEELVRNEGKTVDTIREISDTEKSLALVKLNHEASTGLLKQRQEEVRQIEAHAIAAREEVERLKKDLSELTVEIRGAKREAMALSEGLEPSDERFQRQFGAQLAALPRDRDSLEERLHEITAVAECFQGTLNHQILKHYEESTKLLKSLDKEINQLRAASMGVQEEADNILSLWLPKMHSLIDLINERFCPFFAAMKCVGVVELDQGTDQTVYDQYGLVIKVKFRNVGELLALDGRTQSGGERALTTAVYLLSLQAITQVPFRCVDEINQGMDEINEKRVYHLIFNSISTCDSAQYFLVTPTFSVDPSAERSVGLKFKPVKKADNSNFCRSEIFPDVEYPESTCVHCVHSTSFQRENNDKYFFDKEKYLEKLFSKTKC